MGLLLTSCMSQSVAGVGEGPIPLADAIPMVSVYVTDEIGTPVPNALLSYANESVEADRSGVGEVAWRGDPLTVNINAPGFFPGAVEVVAFSEEPVTYSLRPVVLRGTVMDSAGYGLAGATVHLGTESVKTDESGVFALERAIPGPLTVQRPGWYDAEVEWSGDDLVAEVSMEPMIIRGLHVGGTVVGDPVAWSEMLAIAEDTVVNALVIDLKDESGRIFYDSQVALARRVGAVDPAYDLASIATQMEADGLYRIGRIVAFQDPIAAQFNPEFAVGDSSTGEPFNKNGQYFLDPTDPTARAYALDLAVEACDAGLDEIQFDYVRYPDGFGEEAVFDGGSEESVRVEAITQFLSEANANLHPRGCAVAADIFGFITSVSHDGGIGQQFEELVNVADVVSPMIYPSHYSTGWFGFNVPNDNPGPVVSSALADGLDRLDGPAIIRPWLQDFYYDTSQVRAQIAEAERRSVGWMLWNAASRFQVGALDPIGDEIVAPTTDQGGDGP
jgi:hypothetical protein